MKKVVFGGVLVVLLATTALFGQTKVNGFTQLQPNVVLTAVVTITPTQLKAMGVDGSGAVVIVAYDGTHIIAPLTLTSVLIPGTTPYDVGDIYLSVFSNGTNPGYYFPAYQGAEYGLDSLTSLFTFINPSSAPTSLSVTDARHDVVFGGTGGTTPLTLGDSSLRITLSYMLI